MFLGILIVGLVYVWKRGDISWIKPAHIQPSVSVGIPHKAYEQLNNKKYNVRDYKKTVSAKTEDTDTKVTRSGDIGFRPKIKK